MMKFNRFFFIELLFYPLLGLALIYSVESKASSQTKESFDVSFAETYSEAQKKELRGRAEKLLQEIHKDGVIWNQVFKATLFLTVADLHQQNTQKISTRKRHWAFIDQSVRPEDLPLLASLLEEMPLEKLIANFASSLPHQASYLIQILNWVPQKILNLSPKTFWKLCSTKKNWLNANEYETCLKDYVTSFLISNKKIPQETTKEIFNNLLIAGMDLAESSKMPDFLKLIKKNKIFDVTSQSLLEQYYQVIIEFNRSPGGKNSETLKKLLDENKSQEFLTKILKVISGLNFLLSQNYDSLESLLKSEGQNAGFVHLRLQNLFIRALIIQNRLDEAATELRKVPLYPQLNSFYFTFFNELNFCLIENFRSRKENMQVCKDSLAKFKEDFTQFNIYNSDVFPFFEVWNSLLQKELNAKSASISPVLKLTKSLNRVQPTKLILERIQSKK